MPQVHIINPTRQSERDKLRLAAYCRVSTDSSDQINSYLSQINYYTKYISDNPDWELHDIYADEGTTGTRADKREDFQRMLRDCRRGLIDKIIVKSVSRFARNSKDCIAVVRELHSLGISVVFEKEHLDTEKLGSELFLSMYSTFAQEESISISGNMRWSYQKRMQSGRFITCRSCYGYTLENGNLIVNEPEAIIVRRIFQKYLSGKGMQEIADELNRDGISKRYNDGEWYFSNIHYTLTNEKYVGDSILQKLYTTQALPFQRFKNHGQEAQYLISNSHPAIISRSDFDATQALIEQRGNNRTHSEQSFLLRKMQCGKCGSAFIRHSYNNIVYWVCCKHRHDKDQCPVKQIAETEILEAFVRLWNTLTGSYQQILHPLLNGLKEIQNREVYGTPEHLNMNREIAELNEQNLVLNQLFSKGYMDATLYMEQIDIINSKLNRLRKQRRQLRTCAEDDTIPQLRALISIMEIAEPITEFDEICFERIIKKIIVDSQESIRFRLIGNLELTEPIKRYGRWQL